jgi:hypothetical protein
VSASPMYPSSALSNSETENTTRNISCLRFMPPQEERNLRPSPAPSTVEVVMPRFILLDLHWLDSLCPFSFTRIVQRGVRQAPHHQSTDPGVHRWWRREHHQPPGARGMGAIALPPLATEAAPLNETPHPHPYTHPHESAASATECCSVAASMSE